MHELHLGLHYLVNVTKIVLEKLWGGGGVSFNIALMGDQSYMVNQWWRVGALTWFGFINILYWAVCVYYVMYSTCC